MKRTLIAVLILSIATAAIATPPPGRLGAPGRGPAGLGCDGPGPRGSLPPARLAEFLDLTEAQVAQVQALRQQQEDTIRPLREQMRANHEAMEEALAAGNSARAGEVAVANYNLRQQIKAAHDAYKTSFEVLLTAAQKAKWAVYVELMELRRE